jgi:hypothetical protein
VTPTGPNTRPAYGLRAGSGVVFTLPQTMARWESEHVRRVLDSPLEDPHDP